MTLSLKTELVAQRLSKKIKALADMSKKGKVDLKEVAAFLSLYIEYELAEALTDDKEEQHEFLDIIGHALEHAFDE